MPVPEAEGSAFSPVTRTTAGEPAELMALAELQPRVDREYFVPAAIFHRMSAELGPGMRSAGARR
jgi:hypothetical protein